MDTESEKGCGPKKFSYGELVRAMDNFRKKKSLEEQDLGGSIKDYNEQEIECLMIVELWCAHPDNSQRPSIKKAIHVLNFEAVAPSPIKVASVDIFCSVK
ncbi:unnamed protein product [Fraxinus pennsylvanica]|uniref:Serine-threonine/tyrosine-protein kinase catalytic domain-containing protein n=1 Tax=Fraxinus pennsylvanica TaxID=56036 RepID=A0AAD1ZLK9_9LAMI|nr:unnamed protein product [Fraxinus pennsylvanica]